MPDDPNPASTRSQEWYFNYLLDALEPHAPERRETRWVDALADAAVQFESAEDIGGGFANAIALERAWFDQNCRPDGTVPSEILKRGLGQHPLWSLPPARAVETTHERNGLYALWINSTYRASWLSARAAAGEAERRTALCFLRGTVSQPDRLWRLHTRPTGARLAGEFLVRAAKGEAVEDVKPPLPLAQEGRDLVELEAPPPTDEPRFYPEARLVASLLACAQHRRTCAEPGGLQRLLSVVLLVRCPEISRAALDHADEQLLSGMERALLLWDAVCASLEVPIRRWLRRRSPRLSAEAFGALWGWSAEPQEIPAELLQVAMSAVGEWHQAEFRPRCEAALAAEDPAIRDALGRFYLRGQSLRNVGRQLTANAGEQVEAAVDAITAVLPGFARALQAQWTASARRT